MSDATSFLACHLDKFSPQHISFCFCSDDGAGDEEDEEYEPPARQLRSASRPMKCKVASVVLIQANREVTNSQGRRVRIPLHLVVTMRSDTLQVSLTLWHKLLHLPRGNLQDLDLTPQNHGHC
ncbi:hypothetical protein ILYODFUR_036959 [Ilyodon furcidens]|uniref:Uncharacterized protein n=1 Tax=Ilyodon furcidens TaxID=33524 RepID=A0ABV0TE50_9TELE